jgi:hypothetical protein
MTTDCLSKISFIARESFDWSLVTCRSTKLALAANKTSLNSPMHIGKDDSLASHTFMLTEVRSATHALDSDQRSDD